MNVKFNRLASPNRNLEQFWTGSKLQHYIVVNRLEYLYQEHFSKQKEQLYIIQFEWFLLASALSEYKM